MNQNKIRKSPILVALLSVCTLGIYDLIWIAKTTKFLSDQQNDTSQSPMVEVLLCIFSFGFYKLIWFYQYSKALYAINYKKSGGAYQSDYSMLYILLCFFFLGFVAMGIFQNNINRLLTASTN